MSGLDRGVYTSADLVSAYIKRTEEVDGVHKSVIEVNPEALSIARSMDEEAKESGRRGYAWPAPIVRFLFPAHCYLAGKSEPPAKLLRDCPLHTINAGALDSSDNASRPLHGVPVLLKDNIVTLDRMECTSGAYALLGAKPSHESTVAQKLRDAGAILLGKTNLSEWANAQWTNASTGWSPRGGQCTGPFYPRMKASGSSTGSAVATILGLTSASLGTETGGSIIDSAGKASVVGLSASDTPVVKDPLGDLITSGPGTPHSISFFARRFQEEALFKLAYAFEQMHDKGSSKMWTVPTTDLQDIVQARTSVEKS